MAKTFVGLDIGSSAVKTVASSGDGVRTEVDFPSAFCRATKLAVDSAAGLAAQETVSAGGVKYFVGNTAPIGRAYAKNS